MAMGRLCLEPVSEEMRGPCGPRRDLGFILKAVGAPESPMESVK